MTGSTLITIKTTSIHPGYAMTRYIAIIIYCLLPLVLKAQDAKPSTFEQIKAAIDWEKLPLLEGAAKVRPFFNHTSYEAPGTFKQAAEFYRRELRKLGWKEDTSIESGDQTAYLSVQFEKEGQRLGLSGYRSKPEDPMTITLMLNGNVDVSTFPKVDDAQIKVNQKNSVYYFTKKPADEVVSFCKKFMLERGWAEKPNPNAEMWAKEGRYVLEFDQNAIKATLVVANEKDGNRSVSYSSGVQHEMKSSQVTKMVTNKDQVKPATLKQAVDLIDLSKLPKPDKASKVKAIPIALSFEMNGSIEDASKFYRKLLKETGWKESTSMVESDSLAILYFNKAGFMLVLTAARHKKEGPIEVSIVNKGNVDIRKLPFPKDAEIGTTQFEFINTTTKLSVEQAEEFYKKELPLLGWKPVSRLGKGVLHFSQNAVELSIEVQTNAHKQTSIQIHTRMR